MHKSMLVGRQAQEENVISEIEEHRNQSRHEILERVTEALHGNFRHYTGVYIYLLVRDPDPGKGETLVLANYRGRPTEHTRIPLGAGICGRAARVKQTVTVDDVTSDSEYIACSLDTKSEIVVPIMREGTVLAEIDIDSDVPAAFKPEDRAFLERLAKMLQEQF